MTPTESSNCSESPIRRPTSEMVAEAYAYLLGRVLVIRQEIKDAAEPGFGYNQVKYNPLGSAEFVNPNLDVAYLEAWFAVDDDSPAISRSLRSPTAITPPSCSTNGAR